MPLARVLVTFQYTLIGDESSVDENSNQFLLYFKIYRCMLGWMHLRSDWATVKYQLARKGH